MTLVARYLVEGAEAPTRLAAALCAALGDGADLAGGGAAVRDVTVRGRRGVDRKLAEVTVEVSLDRVGTNLIALLALLLGEPFDLPRATGVRLLDFEVPEQVAAAAPGPAFGIDGTRRLAGVRESRPLIGSIIKPSVGLTPAQTADRVRELGDAGLDFIKDDELMSSPANSPLAERVAAVTCAIADVAEQTGRKPLYAFNISAADVDELLRNHDLVAEAGGTCVMVSVNHVGPAALLALRARAALPIHAHRNGWGMLTRCAAWGMGFRPFQKAWRLLGVDHLHVNGFANKFWEPDESVAASIRDCLEPLHSVLSPMPVVSSGQWGGQAHSQFAATGTTDLIYLAGGGIQGHPGGAAAGVRAVREAWRAALDGEPLEQRARAVPELASAIELFGARGG